MRDGQDLNTIVPFPINEDVGKTAQQKPAGLIGAERPALWSPRYLAECSFHLSVQSERRVWAAPKVPLECGVVLGSRFLMQFNVAIGHVAA